jgi:hypothetical protein
MAKVVRRIPAAIRLRLEAAETWAELLKWARRHEAPRFVFRGQSQKWALKPTAGRASNYDQARERQLFDEFKRLASPFVDRSAVATDWDWLFVAQHHGLPTRLLDWTTNPLVAAYFACQSSGRGKRPGVITAVEVNDVGLANIDTNPFEIGKAGFVYPTAVAARISSQRGLFSVHPDPSKNWILRGKREIFEVPAAHKELLLGFLFGVGVDAAMVMADLDGLASNLGWRYRNGHAIQ